MYSIQHRACHTIGTWSKYVHEHGGYYTFGPEERPISLNLTVLQYYNGMFNYNYCNVYTITHCLACGNPQEVWAHGVLSSCSVNFHLLERISLSPCVMSSTHTYSGGWSGYVVLRSVLCPVSFLPTWKLCLRAFRKVCPRFPHTLPFLGSLGLLWGVCCIENNWGRSFFSQQWRQLLLGFNNVVSAPFQSSEERCCNEAKGFPQ